MLDAKIVELIQNGLIAAVGGVANYFYYLEKHRRALRLLSFLTNCLLSFFVGMVIGEFLPASEYSYGALMICGFCCYPILGYFEIWVLKYIEKFMGKPPVDKEKKE